MNVDQSPNSTLDGFIESVKKLQKRMQRLYQMGNGVLEKHQFERLRISMTNLEYELLNVVKNTIIRHIPKPLFTNKDLRIEIEDLMNNVEIDAGKDPLYDQAVRIIKEANAGSVSLLPPQIANWLHSFRSTNRYDDRARNLRSLHWEWKITRIDITR